MEKVLLVGYCKFFRKVYETTDQELINVYYCTAVQTNIEKKDRQDLFFSANKITQNSF